MQLPEGNALVYCEGAFNTTNGKTAHGLVRFTRRYRVAGVLDARHAGRDAGEILDGTPVGIPVYRDLSSALAAAAADGRPATHFVVGIAPDGGRLEDEHRRAALAAVEAGLHVDCGLHDFLSEDPGFAAAAQRSGVRIRDIRRPPPRGDLHFFSGKVETVGALTVAVLGTDSAVGKRTTAWLLVQGLEAAGIDAEMVGTGQTAWLQGARFGVVMDALVNDFVSGEIEHAVWSSWNDRKPGVIVVEGQGSLMNPAYPGGFEILAAARPDVVVLQHAPARKEYDGFPGYPIHPLPRQIEAIELLSAKPVVAVTVNHEGMDAGQTAAACAAIRGETGRPAVDVLRDGPGGLVEILRPFLGNRP